MKDELSEAWERSSVSNSVDQWFCRLWLRCASVNPSQQWVRSGGVWLFRLHYIYLVKRALNCSTQVWKDATLAGINEQHSSDWADITRVHLHKKWIWNTSKSRDANGPRRQNLISELNFLSRRKRKKSLKNSRGETSNRFNGHCKIALTQFYVDSSKPAPLGHILQRHVCFYTYIKQTVDILSLPRNIYFSPLLLCYTNSIPLIVISSAWRR